MQRHRFIFVLISVLLAISLAFVFGCAKKATVKDTSEEKQVVAEKKSTGETDAEKAAREKALREAELREQERLRAERERAAAERAKAEAVSPFNGFEYIYFDFDKFAIKTEARETLKKVADKLNATSGGKLLIEGNCDERGTVEYNLALGERRANAAMKYLVSLGIGKDKVSTVSYGKERPVDPGHTEEAWAKNRNAHFVMK